MHQTTYIIMKATYEMSGDDLQSVKFLFKLGYSSCHVAFVRNFHTSPRWNKFHSSSSCREQIKGRHAAESVICFNINSFYFLYGLACDTLLLKDLLTENGREQTTLTTQWIWHTSIYLFWIWNISNSVMAWCK